MIFASKFKFFFGQNLDFVLGLYSDIDKQYRDIQIAYAAAQLAEKDLKKYHGALDKALMKYHSMKMAEVNKIVKELWQQIYRG